MRANATSRTADPPVGVLVVDNQRVFRRAALDVVEAAAPGFIWLGEAASGEEALAATKALEPDLVLIDVRMDGMDGIDTARRIADARPDAVVVLVTTEDPLRLPAEVGFCGAAEVIRKQDLRPMLLRRLWSLHGMRERR